MALPPSKPGPDQHKTRESADSWETTGWDAGGLGRSGEEFLNLGLEALYLLELTNFSLPFILF